MTQVTKTYHWHGQELLHEFVMERIVYGFLCAMGYRGKFPPVCCAYSKLGKYRGVDIMGQFVVGRFGKHGRKVCMVLVRETRSTSWSRLIKTLAHESVHMLMHLRGKKTGHGKWFKQYALMIGAKFL